MTVSAPEAPERGDRLERVRGPPVREAPVECCPDVVELVLHPMRASPPAPRRRAPPRPVPRTRESALRGAAGTRRASPPQRGVRPRPRARFRASIAARARRRPRAEAGSPRREPRGRRESPPQTRRRPPRPRARCRPRRPRVGRGAAAGRLSGARSSSRASRAASADGPGRSAEPSIASTSPSSSAARSCARREEHEPGRDQLDRKGQAVEPPADLLDGRERFLVERHSSRRRELEEQGRGVLASAVRKAARHARLGSAVESGSW